MTRLALPRLNPIEAALLNLLSRVQAIETRTNLDAVPERVDMRGFRSVRKALPWAFKSVRGAK